MDRGREGAGVSPGVWEAGGGGFQWAEMAPWEEQDQIEQRSFLEPGKISRLESQGVTPHSEERTRKQDSPWVPFRQSSLKL